VKYRKFNRYEKKENRRVQVAEAMSGKGIYVYKNSSAVNELMLPRPTKSGVRKVGPDGTFQGDDYYLQLVRSGELRLVEVIDTGVKQEGV